MDITVIMLGEISQTDKYHISSLICGILKKKKRLIDNRKQEWWLPEATRVKCRENWVKEVKKVKVKLIN